MKFAPKNAFNRTDAREITHPSLFSILSIIPQILICAVVFGLYLFIVSHEYFPLWIAYIYYGVKFIIALQIIIAAARSFVGSGLALALGALNLYWLQIYDSALLTASDAWQLIGIAIAGFFITLLVKILRR